MTRVYRTEIIREEKNVLFTPNRSQVLGRLMFGNNDGHDFGNAVRQILQNHELCVMLCGFAINLQNPEVSIDVTPMIDPFPDYLRNTQIKLCRNPQMDTWFNFQLFLITDDGYSSDIEQEEQQ